MKALENAPTAVAVLDACFSGNSVSGPLVPGLMPVALVDERQAPANVTVLTAAASDEFAGPLPNANRPAFSYLVLGGLRGWADANDDAQITAQEVLEYTEDALSTVLRGEREQHPTLVSTGPGVVLARGSEPAPDLSAILRRSAPSGDSRPYVTWKPAPEAARAQPSVRSDLVEVAPASRQASSGFRAFSLGLAASGGAIAAVGLGLWASSKSATDDLAEQCPLAIQCDAALETKYDKAKKHARLGNLLVPIGAGVAALGLISYFVSKTIAGTDLSRMNLVLNRDGAHVTLAGRL